MCEHFQYLYCVLLSFFVGRYSVALWLSDSCWFVLCG